MFIQDSGLCNYLKTGRSVINLPYCSDLSRSYFLKATGGRFTPSNFNWPTVSSKIHLRLVGTLPSKTSPLLQTPVYQVPINLHRKHLVKITQFLTEILI